MSFSPQSPSGDEISLLCGESLNFRQQSSCGDEISQLCGESSNCSLQSLCGEEISEVRVERVCICTTISVRCAQSWHSFQRGGLLPDISNADVSVHSQFCAKCDSTRRADICRHPRKDAQISQCEVKRKSHNLSSLQIVSRVVARRRSVSCAKRT